MVLFAACAAFKSMQQSAPQITPYRADETYKVGDTVGWKVVLPEGSALGTAPATYQIRRNNFETLQAGDLALAAGKGAIEIHADQPEMLYLEVKSGGRTTTFGAAVSPRDLKPVAPRPRDFDAFWNGQIAQLEAIPPNAVLTPKDSGREGVQYATIRLDLVHGDHVYGQIAWPTTPGKHPAMQLMQWASPPYPLQPSWVLDRAAEGWIALNIEPHEVLPTENRDYYSALPATIKHYESIGEDELYRNYFVEMYLRDYRGLDYLTGRPDWDGKTLLVTGTSMGGQQSLCVAGLHPRVTALIVEVPAGCDLNAGLHGRQEGYPFYNTRDPKAMETAPYIDAVNFAPHIRASCLVAMGYTDTAAPPAGVWTAFNLIRGKKEVVPMPDTPHNNLATREQQMPYYKRAGAWMSALVKGDRLPPP